MNRFGIITMNGILAPDLTLLPTREAREEFARDLRGHGITSYLYVELAKNSGVDCFGEATAQEDVSPLDRPAWRVLSTASFAPGVLNCIEEEL